MADDLNYVDLHALRRMHEEGWPRGRYVSGSDVERLNRLKQCGLVDCGMPREPKDVRLNDGWFVLPDGIARLDAESQIEPQQDQEKP